MSKNLSSGELPPELDFFRYTKNTSSSHSDNLKRKSNTEPNVVENQAPTSKRRRTSPDTSDNEGEKHSGDAPKLSKKHRVVAKGNNVPAPVESFEELRTRYNFPSRMLQNLGKNGWVEPTGIQAHAIPMFLEVCRVDS